MTDSAARDAEQTQRLRQNVPTGMRCPTCGGELLGRDGELLWMRQYKPSPPPKGWRKVTDALDGAADDHRSGLRAILSGQRAADGRRWLHLSLSRKKRPRSWDELSAARDALLPPDRYAYQVLPPRDRWVNIHPYCLHLWCPLDGGPPLPDVSALLPNGRRTI